VTETKIRTEIPPMVLRTRLEMDEEQFFEFCRINRGWRIERTAEGDLEITPPTGAETSSRNFNLVLQLGAWAERSDGIGFDSNGSFMLPNGATRSPDASWMRRGRLANLTVEQKQKFLPLCPDIVIELRSPSDPLPPLETKMREYMENGARRLGWLLDPEERRVYIHQPEEDARILEKQQKVSGDPVLQGFVLDLRPIWETGF
jgi:Uma2 family endonuclease